MTNPQGHTERLETALDGKYRIERKLGEGGMATVYLAEDIKHKRKVALKILRPELAAVIGAERFLTEITTTANLQHPHILPLFDSGAADGYLYYVMPFIDGETLGQKLNREKQLGVNEAVKIAKEVGDALDYAHRNGVIHRDIKPANILLHDGRPVVADFGIALAVSAAGGGRMTETGLSLGTPHYMSPEQASADRDLSARSDVYSLGCVLYEMIAGQPPHTGPSAQSILVRILTESPRPLTEMRHTVPPHISAVVSKAIEKLPADRFDTAKQFIEALDDATFVYQPSGPLTASTKSALAPPATQSGPRGVPIWLAALLGGLLLGGGFALSRLTMAPAPAQPSAEFAIVGDSSVLIRSPCCGRAVAISPAGDRVVYQAVPLGGTLHLYQRPLNQRVAQPVAGTDEGRHPFFSPDGEWLGFFSEGRMLKVRFDGGTPLTVLNGITAINGAAWGRDNTIVYAQERERGLFRVSADGGQAEQITVVDTAAGETGHMWPHVLPDGKTVVFGVAVEQGNGPSTDMLATSPIAGGGHELLVAGADPRFADAGFLVYADGSGSIMAQSFDPKSLALEGSRFRIAERATWRGTGMAEYDLSRTGTLIFREGAGATAGGARDLVLVDLEGKVDVLASPGVIRHPRFSPDGRYIAYEVEGDGSTPDDIWIWDQERANPLRITFEGDNSVPVWSADGDRVFYETATHIMSRAADGSGESEVVQEARAYTPLHISPDGRWLLWTSDGEFDIWLRPLDGSAEARPLIQSAFENFQPAVSPDGRWIAYVSDDSGLPEIYVEPFPDLGRRFKVSTGGALSPVWAPNGSRLFYRAFSESGTDLIAVDVLGGERFDVGDRIVLFNTAAFRFLSRATNYDIHPDGTHFVFIRGGGGGQTADGDTHVVITNALNAGNANRE